MALLLLLATLQSPDIAGLVSRLSDDDVEVHERASQELILAGPLAHPDLDRAAASTDPELAARARLILGSTGPM